MPEVRTYDPNNVTVMADGQFVTGFAEGSFVECEQDEDNFSTKISAQGDVAVAISNNPTGTITITLSQTSPSVSLFDQLSKTKKVFPISVISNNDPKEKVYGTQAMVKKPAKKGFSDKIENREYQIVVFDYTVE
jgi:hypothetical protein